MEQISASTQLCQINPSGGSFDTAAALIAGGTYVGWNLYSSISAVPAEIKLYNEQELSLQGLVAGEQQFTSASIRIEQPEPMRACMGMQKDTNAAPYGFVREYHLFTTKKLSSGEMGRIFSTNNPTLPGFTSAAGTSSELNENQLVYGLCREYNSIQNLVAVGQTTFAQDWRLTPSYENVCGNGYPVAQDRIYYTRLVYCWMNPTTQTSTSTSLVQGLDVPYCRASLIGTISKPNFNGYMATLANNEAIGSW